MTTIDEEDYLAHYGILRKSGRYPWGSGGKWGTAGHETEYQRSMSFMDAVEKMKAQGLSAVDIAKGLDMTTTQLRQATTIANNEKKASDIAQAQRLREKGLSASEIGRQMGRNESSVRDLLAPGAQEKVNIITATTNMLRDQVAEKTFVDVGSGTEHWLGGISPEKKNTALAVLKDEGYEVISVQSPQLGTGPGKKTTIKVLAPPGTKYKDIVSDMSRIQSITAVTDDGGRSWAGIKPPLQIASSRIAVKYKEDGGDLEDGIIYVRPGVADVSLGGSRYAQVRVAVDGTHYLKGVAVYKDDLPPGVDLLFNSAKGNTGNKLDAMKAVKDDQDNPFGSYIRRQIFDEKGEKVTSAMNIVNEEGSWDKWSRNLSSQTLSKQSPKLAKTQLDMTYEKKRAQLDEIMALTNPTVRKLLLDKYAESVDSSAVHLKAAALPRSSWHVILPFNSLKENEVYAPNFENGERVALIRYPHGGTFEIPELTVNNKSSVPRSVIGRAKDAVGINAEVAKRLSGADFDGDAVLVIPNDRGSIKSSPALEGLKNFDPVTAYPKYPGMKVMDKREKAQQMGYVSNLITDMTLQKASTTELAAAIRHSMVVIDAEKKELNWQESARANGIPNLMKKYQGRSTGGASTLISRATSRTEVLARRPRPASKGGPVDKATGKLQWEPTGEKKPVLRRDPTTGRKVPVLVKDADGNLVTKMVPKTQRSQKLKETDDAHTLSSGTLMEKVYADHSNRLKALANEARKASVNTDDIPSSPSARKAYANEVQSLKAKLDLAIANRPLERQAQVLANTRVSLIKQANPHMDEAERKKVASQALTEARRRTGADKQQIYITDREWDAIQSGAVTKSHLGDILKNAQLERVKELATPRAPLLMSSTKLARAKAMTGSGFTQAEIAKALGVSLTTLKEGLKDG